MMRCIWYAWPVLASGERFFEMICSCVMNCDAITWQFYEAKLFGVAPLHVNMIEAINDNQTATVVTAQAPLGVLLHIAERVEHTEHNRHLHEQRQTARHRAPELRKVQEKYRGKKDQLSREAMSRETMALYKKHGTTPVSRRTAT
jgi:hypothetical protein